MSVDDTDEKVRRNLVVFSASVCLFAFLDTPFIGLVGALGDLDSVNPLRLNLAALAILAYLALRYRFSKDVETQRADMWKTLNEFRFDGVRKFVESSFARFDKGADVLPGFASDDLQTLRQAANRLKRNPIIRPETVAVRASFMDRDQRLWWAGLHLRTNIIYVSEVGQRQDNPGVQTTVALPGLIRWVINVRAHLRLFTYSRAAVQYMAPIVLAVAAGLILLWRIVMAEQWSIWLTKMAMAAPGACCG